MSDSKKRALENPVPERLPRDQLEMIMSPLTKEQLLEIVMQNIDMSDALYQSVLAMADRNEDCRNIFVRKVPFSATSKELREAFTQFGPIQECQIIVDKMTGESKGFGFVKFESISSALKAVNSKVYMGAMELNLTIANPNAKRSPYNPLGERKLFIRSLPYEATESDLKPIFEAFGPTQEVVVLRDHMTGKSRGYGFVIFATEEAARACLKEPKIPLMNRDICVCPYASVKPDHAKGGYHPPHDYNSRQAPPSSTPINLPTTMSSVTPQQLYAMQLLTMNPQMMQMAGYPPSQPNQPPQGQLSQGQMPSQSGPAGGYPPY